MSICSGINLCISYSLILLSATWFVFMIMINNRGEDPRVNLLNLMSPTSQSFTDGLYLRKIQVSEQYRDLNSQNSEGIQILNTFQLIEIMNDHSPNILGDEVILIISITNQKLGMSSIKFVEYLYSRSGGTMPNGSVFYDKQKQQNINTQSEQKDSNKQIPIYILKQTEPVILNNQKYLLSYKHQIRETLNYFVNTLDIKKLSLLSFQIGGLLTLYSLSLEKDSRIFNALNKVVLINPFNLETKVFHSPPVTFVQQTIKPAILQNDERFNLFNKLRLIIISTKRTVFQESQVAERYFTFSFKKTTSSKEEPSSSQATSLSTYNDNDFLYRFSNTFTISTRAMSNVFCFFDKQNYFFYEPFVSLLSKFFVQDSKKQFSYDQMEYYFYYKQLPQVKQLSEKTKRKYISKCIDFNLQSYQYGGNTFGGQGKQNEQCIRLLRKQSIYFEESSILLYSKERFEVYGQNFEKLYPFQSKTTYMVYHIQRLNEFRRLFIINKKSALIHMKIAPIFMPLTNPIVSLETQFTSTPIGSDLSQLNFQNLTNLQVIRTCEPANLVFPLHFPKMAIFGQHSLFYNKKINRHNCYTEYDNSDSYPDWFLLNWNIFRNLMIFTLFVSHISQKNLAKRFYTQSMVNEVIVWVSTGSFLLFENFFVMSTLCVFETVLKYLMKGMECLVGVRKVVVKFIWIPVALELASIYYPWLPSSWKVLFLLIGLCLSPHNIYIILMKMSFMVDSIKFDMGNIKGIMLICLWTFIGAFDPLATKKQQNNHKTHNHHNANHHHNAINHNNIQPVNQNNKILKNNSLKKMVLDIAFLFSIGVCISEDGSVIDEIINAYIVMQTILFLNNRFF